jgi:aminoglycoside phosphotransferase (APT) family kinase protein
MASRLARRGGRPCVTVYDEAGVRAALRRVWPDSATVESARIRPLGGGATPRSFLAVARDRCHVLRLPLASPPPLLDLATEARAMRAAARAGCAPAVVAVDLAEGLLLTEYMPSACTPDLVRQPAFVATIVGVLRALHRLDVGLPVYAVGRIAASYFAELELGATRAHSPEERGWADEVVTLGRHFDATYPPTVFCHNDLAASNILVDSAAARLIDFEYAGRGAPLLDLASLAGMNHFAELERRQLLDEYYGASGAVPALRDLDNAIRMLRLLAYFWARVGEERAPASRSPAQLVTSIGATLRQD